MSPCESCFGSRNSFRRFPITTTFRTPIGEHAGPAYSRSRVCVFFQGGIWTKSGNGTTTRLLLQSSGPPFSANSSRTMPQCNENSASDARCNWQNAGFQPSILPLIIEPRALGGDERTSCSYVGASIEVRILDSCLTNNVPLDALSRSALALSPEAMQWLLVTASKSQIDIPARRCGNEYSVVLRK